MSLVQRQKLYERHHGICQICGIHYEFKFMTVDHILPRSKGGSGLHRNIQLACWLCNQIKDHPSPKHHAKACKTFAAWLKGDIDLLKPR